MLKRVLYIEDNPEQLALVQRLIETCVPETIVDVSATSAGAEVYLNRECYDLVISDLKLPGELGTTIIEKLFERERDQPVLLMTAYGWGTSEENVVRREVDRIAQRFNRTVPLLKKFDETSPADFLQVVHDLLNQKFCADGRGPIARLGSSDDARADRDSLTTEKGSVTRRSRAHLRFASARVRAARRAALAAA